MFKISGHKVELSLTFVHIRMGFSTIFTGARTFHLTPPGVG